MTLQAVRQFYGAQPSYQLGIEAYDPNKLGLGPLITQKNDWLGALPIAVAGLLEGTVPLSSGSACGIQWCDSVTQKTDWLLFYETTVAAATRKFLLYEFNRLTATFIAKGFITLTFPAATNHTIRGTEISYDKHNAGTVAVSGTAVTGTGTSWQTDRACVGNRIGFGSADPTQITTWHEIAAIGSDGALTLTASAGTEDAGTPYVIEDLRMLVLTTNATVTNGGLFVAKGLRPEVFSTLGTTIPAAATTDNIRACYWLKSAATITETVGNGLSLQEQTNKQTHMCWLGSGTSTNRLYKFNVRAALTLTAGADTSAFQLSTAVSATLVGTASQANNCSIAALGHGPGAGSECYYFTTTTRVYRTKPADTIIANDTTWLTAGDSMAEVPPGGVSTHLLSNTLTSLHYLKSIDKLWLSTGVNGFRDYLTQYRTDGAPYDRIFGGDTKQLHSSTADSNAAPSLTKNAIQAIFTLKGLAFASSVTNFAVSNLIYAIPLGADWEYASLTSNYAISPKLALPGVTKLSQLFVAHDQVVGGTSGTNIGHTPEPYRVYFRTAGIDDNSGAWTLVADHGLLTGIDGAAFIQFKFEFRVAGLTCIPARIHSLGLLFDADDALPAELRWHLGDSDNSTGALAMMQTGVFASLVRLAITYYRTDTQAAVLVQDSDSTTNGAWQYWDGSAWIAGLGANTIGTRRRFVPSAGLPVGVDVYAKITAV